MVLIHVMPHPDETILDIADGELEEAVELNEINNLTDDEKQIIDEELAKQKEAQKVTYEKVIRLRFTQEMWNAMDAFNQQFFEDSGLWANMLNPKGEFYTALSEQEQRKVDRLVNAYHEAINSQEQNREDLKDYDKVVELAKAMQAIFTPPEASIMHKFDVENNKKRAAHQYAAENFAKRGADAIGPLTNFFNIPRLVQNANIVLTHGESHHLSYKPKLSFFKKVGLFLKSMVSKESYAELKEQETNELRKHHIRSSLQKSGAGMISRGIAKMFTNTMKQHGEHVTAANDFGKAVEAQKAARLDINLDDIREQAKQKQKTRQKKEPDKGVGGVLAQAGVRAAVGVLGNKVRPDAPKMGKYRSRVVNAPMYKLADVLDWYSSIDETKRNEGDLSAELRQVFENQSKKIAFDAMHDFFTDIYPIYETIARTMESHTSVEVDYKALGFGHLESKDFKTMMEQLARSLGYDIDQYVQEHPEHLIKYGQLPKSIMKKMEGMTDNEQKQWVLDNLDEVKAKARMPAAVHLLMYATPEEKQRALDKFVTNDENVFQAATIFTREHTRMQNASPEDKKDNVHYNLLVDKTKQVVENLQNKERMQQAVSVGLRELGPRVYDAKSNSFGQMFLQHFANETRNNLDAMMRGYLAGPELMQLETSALASAMGESVADELSKMIVEALEKNHAETMQRIREKYGDLGGGDISNIGNPTVYAYVRNNLQSVMNWARGIDPETDRQIKRDAEKQKMIDSAQVLDLERKIDRKSLPLRNQEWQLAGRDVTKSGMPRIARQTMINIIHERTNIAWRKEAVKTLEAMYSNMGGNSFLDTLKSALEGEIKTLSGSPKSQLQTRLELLDKVIAGNFQNLDELTNDEFRDLFLAIHDGSSAMLKNESYKNFHEQADLHMLNRALGGLNLSYITPQAALKGYQEVYQTMFDEKQTDDLGLMQKLIAKKAGDMAQSMMNGIVASGAPQFEYYIKESSKRKAQTPPLESIPVEVKPEEQPGWLEWGMQKAKTGAYYTAGAAVAYSFATPILAAGTVVGTILAADFAIQVADRKWEKDAGDIQNKEDLNQKMVDLAKETIREQAYDAMLDMAYDLYMIERIIRKSQPEAHENLAQKYGFADLDALNKFSNDIAKQLGFNNIGNLALEYGMVKDAKPTKDKVTQRNVETAKARLEEKRSAFTKLPKTEQELKEDPFVYLKRVVQDEMTRLNDGIAKDNLKGNQQNHLLMVSAMDDLVSRVQLVQKETLAVELFGPDILNTFVFDEQKQGWWSALVEVAAEHAQSFAVPYARTAVAGQLQGNINLTKGFANGLTQKILEDSNHILKLNEQAADKARQKAESELKAITTTQDVRDFVNNNQSFINEASLSFIARLMSDKSSTISLLMYEKIREKKSIPERSLARNYLAPLYRAKTGRKDDIARAFFKVADEGMKNELLPETLKALTSKESIRIFVKENADFLNEDKLEMVFEAFKGQTGFLTVEMYHALKNEGTIEHDILRENYLTRMFESHLDNNHPHLNEIARAYFAEVPQKFDNKFIEQLNKIIGNENLMPAPQWRVWDNDYSKLKEMQIVYSYLATEMSQALSKANILALAISELDETDLSSVQRLKELQEDLVQVKAEISDIQNLKDGLLSQVTERYIDKTSPNKVDNIERFAGYQDQLEQAFNHHLLPKLVRGPALEAAKSSQTSIAQLAKEKLDDIETDLKMAAAKVPTSAEPRPTEPRPTESRPTEPRPAEPKPNANGGVRPTPMVVSFREQKKESKKLTELAAPSATVSAGADKPDKGAAEAPADPEPPRKSRLN